jgi:hypothetical protein
VLSFGRPASGAPGAASISGPLGPREQRDKLMREIARRVDLAFHALAKMESLMKSVVWGKRTAEAEAAMQRKYSTFVQREVEYAFSQMGNGQTGINRLFSARGKLAEAQAAKGSSS